MRSNHKTETYLMRRNIRVLEFGREETIWSITDYNWKFTQRNKITDTSENSQRRAE